MYKENLSQLILFNSGEAKRDLNSLFNQLISIYVEVVDKLLQGAQQKKPQLQLQVTEVLIKIKEK